MKKTTLALRLAVFLLTLLLCLIPLVSCGDEEGDVSCKITFKIDGKTYTTVDYVEGKVLSLPPDPAKAGFEFNGWFLDPDCTQPLKPEAYKSAETLTVYAGWIDPELVGKFKVSVNLGGKGTHDDLYIKSGSTVSGITLPEVTGYTVVGWYTDASFETPFDVWNDTVTGNMTLYAKWDYTYFTATLKADGVTVGTIPFHIGTETLELPAVPEKRGYVGTWESYTLGTSAITINAVYTPIRYNIVYWNDKGVDHGNQATYTIEDEIVLAPASHPDFLFVGWFNGGEAIERMPAGATGDMLFTAVWEKKPATIHYAGVTAGEHTNPTSFRESAEDHTLSSPNRPWYRFDGWFTDEALTQPITVLSQENVTDGMTLYAKFTPITYTVTYMNGETPVGTDTFSINDQTPTPPALPQKTGYVASWGTFVPSPGDQYVYASFSPVVYQITYHGITAGAENPNPTTYTIESTVSLLAPSKAGYFFRGWTLGGESVTEIPAGTTGNLTLEADFGLIEYAIYYRNLYGISDAAFPKEFTTESATITLPTGLEREGYTFLGWSLGGELVTEIPRGSVGNISLSARWAAKEYRITYLGLVSGAENPNPATYTIESAFTLLDPGASGYTFLGWTKNGEAVTEIPLGSTGDITLTADFTAVTYTIGYLNIGDLDSTGWTTSYTAADTVTLPTGQKRTGETLTGWLLDGRTVTALEIGTVGNLSLTAVWTPDVYQITYGGLLAGDTNPNPVTYTVKDRVELLSPSRAGYRFLGWKQGETPVSFLAEGSTGNVTLTATWETVTYTVSYENTYAASLAGLPTEFTILSDAIALPSVTTAGRTFIRWTANGVPVTEIPKGSVGNLTLRAEWQTVGYSITYQGILDTDKNDNPAGYNIDSTVTLKAPERAGHTFLGWKKDGIASGGIEAGSTGDVTFVAYFEPIVYTITYENMLGVSTESFPKTYTVLSETVTLPTGLSSPGGTFLGFKKDGAAITEIPAGSMGDITVTATWETIRYQINYFGLESGDSNPNPATYTIAETVVLKAPIRLGYTFAGWTRNGQLITEIPEGTTGTVNLTASFVLTEYHITYSNTKGADISTFPSRYTNNGTKVTLPTLEPPVGFVFTGWVLPDGTPVTEIVPGTTGDVALTATFQPTTYTLTLHPMGGTLATKQVEVRVDEPYSLPVPTKEGYAFLGWYLNTGDDAGAMTGADGASLADYPYGSNRILYARYTPLKYTVSFVSNGGGAVAAAEYSYGELFRPADHKTSVGTGAYFAGWYTADGSTEYTAQTPVTSNVVLYAEWLESIPISSAEELLAIRDNPSATYHLTGNITFLGKNFEPIPEFSGILDGNGYSIRNFTLSNSASTAFAMFVKNTGTIKNLTVQEFTYTFDITSFVTSLNAGILTAVNEGVIENCTMDGSDTLVKLRIHYSAAGNTSRTYWGIFAGTNTGIIRGSENSVSVDFTVTGQTYSTSWNEHPLYTHYYFGGIAGNNASTGMIESVRSLGTVTLTATAAKNGNNSTLYSYFGAVAGQNEGTCQSSYADLTLALDGVSSGGGAVYLYAGGFVGRNTGSVANSSAVGSITGGAAVESYIGGFVGYNVGTDAVIRGSHSALRLNHNKGGGNIGGFVGRNDAKIMTSYASGDVTSTVSGSTGGFVGYASNGSTVTQSFCTGNVSKPSGNTGAFVGAHGTTSVSLKCFYLSNATLTVGGVRVDHVTENDNIVGKTYIELLSEELLVGSLEWNDGDWILLFDETPILAWEKDIGHEYDITVVEPDCESFGYSVYNCTHCGRFFLADFTDAWGHTYEEKDAVVVAPTCSASGYTSHHCRICEEEVRTDITPPLTHRSDDTVIHKDATCTEAGYDRYTCALCGETYDTVIPAKGHAPVTEIAYQAPTCKLETSGEFTTAVGYTAKIVCSDCGAVTQERTEIAPHKYVLTETTTAPSCTSVGYGTYTCQYENCGHRKENAEIPALGHNDQNRDGCCDTCLVFVGREGMEFVEIYTVADLQKITENPSGAFILMNDIDLSGVTFVPLCSERSPFTGYLDGNGKKLLNLDCGDVARGGLFAYIGIGGVVRNLTVSNVTAHITQNGIFGAIAATNEGIISGCTVTGKIDLLLYGLLEVNSQSAHTQTVTATFGGLVGENKGAGAMIYGCTVSGEIDVTAKNRVTVNVKNSVLDYIRRKTADLKNTVSITAGAIAGVNQATIESCQVLYSSFEYHIDLSVLRPDTNHQFGFAYLNSILDIGSVAGTNSGSVINTADGIAVTEVWDGYQPSYSCNTWANNITYTATVK